ncbi:hypothetical protein AB0H73_05880 [Streptomyces olivoreticuli]
MSEQTATLWIDAYFSKCGKCKRRADPKQSHHISVVGPGIEVGTRGCGALFVKTASLRHEFSSDDLLAVRPDLPVGETFTSSD